MKISCIETDKQALLKLKQGFISIDPSSMLSNWKIEVDCCQWSGVSCSNLTGHVTQLDLEDLVVSSNIDSSLCDLQHLTYLNIYFYNFIGSKIPECIGSLGQLRELSIVGSYIGGTIPRGLQNLSNLQTLRLDYNNLIVNDLEWISHLSSLRYLCLSGNNLSQAIDWLSSLSKALALSEIYLEDCDLGGTIPRGLQNLSNLQTLHLDYNNLIVNDLEWISHLSSLRYLSLSGNNLSQAIDWPSSLSKSPALSEIYLDQCVLMSHVNPASFVHTNSSTTLKVLSLSHNYLDSSILPWLSNISKVLIDLDLSYNTLDYIPPNALNINSLEVLNLESNTLQLISPKAFSNMNSLESLDLLDNSLRHIPSDAFTNTTSLEYLDLSNNKLESSMQKSIQTLCQLKTLALDNNNFLDQLSDWIPKLGCAQNSIEHLSLSGNPFASGPFPDFSSFSEVVVLGIQNTSLQGSIPQSFGHLPYLSLLYLSDNNLTGPLPVFAGLVSLMVLDLSNNRLNGNIHPSAFGQVPNLVALWLSSNRLNCVLNETHLSNLTKLTVLDVSQNLIVFNFSSNRVPSFQLQSFSASSCNFGPHFPRWLKYQRELQMLEISNASIFDSIPQWLWLNSFRYLNISHNKLYGELPKSVLTIEGYTWDLTFNHLSGALPHFPPYATALLLSNNMFSGNISSICETFHDGLYYLDISSNFLSGKLPNCWEQLPYLSVLRLDNNHFYGAIPNSVGTLYHLQSIHLNNNNLSGNLPSLMNSSNLLFIDFGQNNLNGTLPSWIGRYLHNLIGLRLQANKLQGSIPTNLCNLQDLQILDLSRNNITGNIPHCFSNLSAMSNMTARSLAISYLVAGYLGVSSYMDTATLSWKGEDVEYSKILGLLKTIDLSCNYLTGEIPSAIATLVALASLNLSRNNLKGPIPFNLGQMERLESLDLSRNSLSGEIPISFSNLSFLSVLNLSFNDLSGKIPTATQLQTFDASSFMGNPGLCGPPFTEGCLNPNPHNIDVGGDDNLISFGFYVSMALGFIVGFWGVCGTLILNSSWKRSFVHFFEYMNDWIYVEVAILKTKIKRRFYG
ncbi:hypothetical protein QN277_024890 [Acacia crassicarpa]|uniref:Leucine-rich repeat-containing N-terminal plant-type domain-containing protein n=1 Tax=Acacia crassicarpa TaxID=499986 RepID=A0AAE1K8D3_9FABA|nr:hypothetical protein QN277_024890 [Acacia crassicarpa]